MSDNLIGYWPNVSRAYEVAKLGGFSIELVFDYDEYPMGRQDCDRVRKFFSDVEFKAGGDLVCEIMPPREAYKSKHHRFETLNDIQDRVCKATPIESIPLTITSASESLLKTAMDRLLGHSLTVKEQTVKIARVIAALGRYSEIKIEHLAEAIQYQARAVNNSDKLIGNQDGYIMLPNLDYKIRELSPENRIEFMKVLQDFFTKIENR